MKLALLQQAIEAARSGKPAALATNLKSGQQALVLSTVRLAIWETWDDSETAMVRPSRALTSSMT